jgi:hypothetical protein
VRSTPIIDTEHRRHAAGEEGNTMWQDDVASGRIGSGWPFGSGGPHNHGRSGGSVPPSQMRVSDAERNEIAEALGKHFSYGRLDQAELDERMSKAMSAKTRADLAGLLDDLPPLPPPPPQPGAVPVHGSAPLPLARDRRTTLLLALIIAFLVQASIGAWFWHPGVLLVSLVIVAALANRRSHRRRMSAYGPWYRYGRYGPWHEPGPGPGGW